MKTKRLIALFLALVMMLSAAACGSKNDGESVDKDTASGADAVQKALEQTDSVSQNDKTLVDNSYTIDKWTVALSGDPQSLDPVYPTSAGGVIFYQMYETLFEPETAKDFDHPSCLLADESRGEFGGYDHEAGTGVYTVYIYDYITDSAGHRITADDVVFCYERYISEGYGTSWMDDWDGIEAIDDTTVQFNFKHELTNVGDMKVYFCQNLIYSRQAFEESPDGLATTACGTGRYVLANNTIGVSVTLEKRPDYWQKEELIGQQHQANIQTVEVQFIPETSQQIMALKTGMVDMIPEMDAQYLADILSDENYVVNSYKDDLCTYLLPNCSESSAMSNLDLRMAVFYAVNTDDIVTGLGAGSVEKCYVLGNDNFGGYDPAWETWENNYHTSSDPELVQKYLDASGYDGRQLQLVCETTESIQNTAAIIQAELQQYGIDLKINALDRSARSATLADPSQWDLYLFTTATTNGSIGGVFELFMDKRSSASGTRTTGYIEDDQLQGMVELVTEASTATSENYDQLQRYVLDNAYAMNLYRTISNTVSRNNLVTVSRMYKFWIYFGGCTFKPEE